MKVLCDVHLPKKLVSFFNEKGIKAIHGSTILNLKSRNEINKDSVSVLIRQQN